MGELNVSLVAVDRKIWSGTATMVVAKTLEGEIGILPQHEPVLALLADSPVRITTTDGRVISAAVHGGFFSVDSDNVAILAETAELGGEIDVDRAREALDRAKAAGADTPDELAAIQRAETRLKVALVRPAQGRGVRHRRRPPRRRLTAPRTSAARTSRGRSPAGGSGLVVCRGRDRAWRKPGSACMSCSSA